MSETQWYAVKRQNADGTLSRPRWQPPNRDYSFSHRDAERVIDVCDEMSSERGYVEKHVIVEVAAL